MNKLVSAQYAAGLVKSGDTIGINGFAFGFGFPEELCMALGERYCKEAFPKDLTLMFASGVGSSGKSEFGLDHFAHDGMISRIIAGHVGLATKLSNKINEGKIRAYNFPQGVVVQMFRAAAGGHPGVMTHVGLKTFADPRVEGGKMNASTTEDLVEVVEIGGKQQLFYHSVALQVAFIRGTTADEAGNITVEKEGVLLETIQIAQAAKNSGGIVIAQVERMAVSGTLDPRKIAVPSIMVDYIVVADKENQRMNFGTFYDPALSGEVRVPLAQIPPMPLSVRKVIAKRCAMELKPDMTVNLGIGVPEGVAAVALEEGVSDRMTMTIEAGSIGGVPGGGYNLGAATNVDAIIGQVNLFDYYDGGGLDITFLGLAQTDIHGNINVSKFGGRMVGCGGFVNISQNTKKVIFCGTFTAGKSDIEIRDHQIHIVKDGAFCKFVSQVEQVTFSGEYGSETGQDVLYVTERAVFCLTEKGLMLTEIAPGVNLQKDILQKMEFCPLVANDLKEMDSRIFSDDSIGLMLCCS